MAPRLVSPACRESPRKAREGGQLVEGWVRERTISSVADCVEVCLEHLLGDFRWAFGYFELAFKRELG